jgi:hypothetical protein
VCLATGTRVIPTGYEGANESEHKPRASSAA